MDDAADDNADNGRDDDDDAGDQNDLPADPRDRSHNRQVSSNIDDEVLQDPLRNDENAQVNGFGLFARFVAGVILAALMDSRRTNRMYDVFVLQEGESDMDFNLYEAETESDSDDNLSTQDAQRSVQTGATHGSDTGEDVFPRRHTPRLRARAVLPLHPPFPMILIFLQLARPRFTAHERRRRLGRLQPAGRRRLRGRRNRRSLAGGLRAQRRAAGASHQRHAGRRPAQQSGAAVDAVGDSASRHESRVGASDQRLQSGADRSGRTAAHDHRQCGGGGRPGAAHDGHDGQQFGACVRHCAAPGVPAVQHDHRSVPEWDAAHAGYYVSGGERFARK